VLNGKILGEYVRSISDRTIVIIFCCLIAAQAGLSLVQKSSTVDEPIHILAGYSYATRGDFRVDPDHPPLVKLIVSIPLLFLDIRMPPEMKQWHLESQYYSAHQFLYEYNDAGTLLLLSRIAVLPLSMILAVFVFQWSKQLFGRGAAIFALFLYSFEPNILAHSRLVNTDLGATCFFYITIYGFYRLFHRVSASRLLLTGLALGLALGTKHSSIILIPVMWLLALSLVASRRSVAMKLLRGQLIEIKDRSQKLIAYSVIWGLYGYRYKATVMAGDSFSGLWSQVAPEQTFAKNSLVWAKEQKVLPEAYLFGLSEILTGMRRPAFLMGEISNGWWYYFLVTFVLKTPLAFLILLGWALALLPKLWRDHPLGLTFLLAPMIIYFGIASASLMNIGHRHLLPIYPFLFVLTSAIVPWIRSKKRLAKVSVAGLAAWYLVSSISIFPHYLAYFNELIGGPNNGHKYLVDSNLDWGQDLKGLKRYMDEHGIQRVWLSYFGTASPDYYRIAYNYLASYVIFNPNLSSAFTPYVAISATRLQGLFFPTVDEGRGLFRTMRRRQPVARIGYSLFLYKLRVQDLRAEGFDETRQ
jgi:hypothetical protein